VIHESVYDPYDAGPQRFGPRRLFKGGGGGNQTTTQSIPDELKPLASAYASQAMQVGQTPFQAYTGQRYADLNANQNQAIDQIQQRATNGSPLIDTANSTITGLLGDNTNPYLDKQVATAQKSLTDSYNLVQRPAQTTAMANSGSFGNAGLEQTQRADDNQLQQNLGNVATSLYSNAYNTNQANKLSALGYAQSYANQPYTDAQQLLTAGNQQQTNTQNNADFAYQQFQDQQNQPYKNLGVLGAPFTGVSLGGSSTTTSSGGGK
jgi:hypothetical protein